MFLNFFHRYRSYFELDHRQAKAYLWLIVLIVIVMVSPLFTYHWYPAAYRSENIKVELLPDQPNIETFDQRMAQKLSFKKEIGKMTVEDWQNAGLPKYLAQRILNYQTKVKRIHNVSDLYKVYGMDSSKVKRVSAYLIEEHPVSKRKGKSKQRKVFPVLDINTADTFSLEALPAIGPVLSKRIVKYRDLLKGFVSKKQYREIYGITENALEILDQQTEIQTRAAVVRLREVNYRQLSDHFYLSSNDARYILGELKRNNKLCWEDLKQGLDVKAASHLEFLFLYFPCEE